MAKAEHLKPLAYRAAQAPIAVDLLTVLVNMAASGDLPQYLQEILLADVMFGLVKPDSSLRPVSIVNVVVKIAATLLMSNVNAPKLVGFWAIERTANLCAEDPEIPQQRICRRKDGCGKCVWHR